MVPGPLTALITTLLIGAPPSPCPEAPLRAHVVATSGAPSCTTTGGDGLTASPEEVARYADLEQKTPAKVADFRGGDAVIYVSTGAAVVIVVVLLVLFL